MPPFDDLLDLVKLSEPLGPLTWFRLGGPAQYFAKPQGLDQLVLIMKRCRQEGLPVRILAGGSNILVRDEGVAGMVVQLESPAFSDVAIEGQMVESGAAVPLTALISQTSRAGLGGLEHLTGIPGTVGGAVRGNSGGRQGTIGQFVRGATVLDDDLEVTFRGPDELAFGYHWSNLDEPVILSVRIHLEPEEPETVVRRMRKVWIVKKENQPYGHEASGMIFKNPALETTAASLIEQAGLKGTQAGGAEVSERHANYIVAHPGATAADVLSLIDLVRSRIKDRFGLELQQQIQVW